MYVYKIHKFKNEGFKDTKDIIWKRVKEIYIIKAFFYHVLI